jgi:uncharacterized protein
MMPIEMKIKCPRCGKETTFSGNPFRPFCSERCKLIDLGHWVQGAYRVAEDPSEEDESSISGREQESEEQ